MRHPLLAELNTAQDRGPDAPPPILHTFDGRRLVITHTIDPVIDLARLALAGHRIEPQFCDLETGRPLSTKDRSELLASDTERVDAETLTLGLDRLPSGPVQGEHPTLILAISFLTASSLRARTKLLPTGLAAQAAMQNSVIWLLTDLPEGLPVGRLIEVAAVMKAFGRAVFARTALNSAVLKLARPAGIAGLVLEPQRPLTHETDAALWLLQAGRMAERAAPALVAAGLPSTALFGMAAEAGFTHATVRGAES